MDKINLLITRIITFSGMDDIEKEKFIKNLTASIIGNIAKDSDNMVSQELLDKLELNPTETTIKALIKELMDIKDGKEIIKKNILLSLYEMIAIVQDKLTIKQKAELIEILES